jgi:molybdate transport system substrate-binding protein
MRSSSWFVGILLVVSGALGGCRKEQPATQPAGGVPQAKGAPAGGGKLKLFIPCGMIIPFTDATTAFEKTHPGIKVESVYDNATVLVEKVIQKGERPDVFVSPGHTEIQRLIDKGLVDDEAQISVAQFKLVALARRDSKIKLEKPEDLRKCKTISMPDPETNSVGASAKGALQKLGLWDELEPKIITTKHAIESHQFVGNGKSDAGFAYDNCPLDTAPEKLSKLIVKPAFYVDESLYDRQDCVVAAMKEAPNAARAQEFVRFLDSKEARTILEKGGLKGCVTAAADAKPIQTTVKVTAFYPDNEGHKHVRAFIEGLNKEYPGKVRAEFLDFTAGEGFKRWREAGLSCGTVMIDGSYDWTYEKDGQPRQVIFQMGMDGQWTQDDVRGVIEKLLKEKEKEAGKQAK